MKGHTAITTVLVALVIKYVHTYTIDYWDCTKPNAIQEYDLGSYCETQQLLGKSQLKQYHVLQKKKKTTMKGWNCNVIRSTFVLHCGMFSHQDFVQMPDIEIKIDVPLQQCQNMINTKYMTTKEGSTHQVELGAETIFHVSELGILHEESNKIWCEGQEMKINQNIIEGVLKMVQYRVTIQEDTYVIDKERVEALSDHRILPKECTPFIGGCISGEKTYIWKIPKTECPLTKINTGKFETTEDGWLIEKQAKLIFKLEDRAKAPAGCPQGEILYTEYSDLYLTEVGGFEHTPEIVDFSLYVRQSSDYVIYEAERMAALTTANTMRKLCQEQYRDTKMEIIKIDKETFGRRAGGVLYTFTCTKKTGKLQATNECYDRIPLMDNMYIEPITMIATNHTTPRICNKYFPDKVYTHEGWVSLPSLQQVKEPKKMERKPNGYRHEDMSQSGLYTNEELDQWNDFLHYGHFQNSIMEKITTGTCVNQKCHDGEVSHLPNYNLELLAHTIANKFSIWEKVTAWISNNGAYLSAMVLTIYLIKLGLWTSLMFHTVIREGKEVAVTILYATCCGAMYKWGRILKRSKKTLKVPTTDEPQDELQNLA